MELEEQRIVMEDELRRKKQARIQKLKEEEELQKMKKDIRNIKSNDDTEDEIENKNCACKCQIY